MIVGPASRFLSVRPLDLPGPIIFRQRNMALSTNFTASFVHGPPCVRFCQCVEDRDIRHSRRISAISFENSLVE